jgi:hypothetical protein
MRSLIVAAAVLTAVPAGAKPASPTQLEMETWRAFRAKNVTEIRSLFAPDFVGLYPDGTHDLARELQALQHVTIENYKLADLKSKAVDANDVLLTYSADFGAVVDGKPVSQRLWMASLWHRSGGRWLCAYHTEIKAK